MPRSLLAVLCVAVALVCATVLWLREPAAPPPPTDAPGAAHDGSPGVARAPNGASPVATSDPSRSGTSRTQPTSDQQPRPEPALVRGLVVDHLGQPLVGAVVRAADGATARSEAGGWFAVTQRALDARATRLLFSAPGHAPVVREVLWGSTGHRVELAVAGLVQVDVVDGQSQAAIEGFTLQVVAAGGDALQADPVALPGPHAHGHVEARCAVGSPALLRVVADDERYAPSAMRLVELRPDRPASVRIELFVWRELSVEVVDARGEPVARAQVEVLSLPPELRGASDTEAVSDWRAASASRAITWFAAATAANGRRVVRVPSQGAFSVRVTHPDAGVVFASHEAQQLAMGAALRVALPR